jgi:hypothetical protein
VATYNKTFRGVNLALTDSSHTETLAGLGLFKHTAYRKRKRHCRYKFAKQRPNLKKQWIGCDTAKLVSRCQSVHTQVYASHVRVCQSDGHNTWLTQANVMGSICPACVGVTKGRLHGHAMPNHGTDWDVGEAVPPSRLRRRVRRVTTHIHPCSATVGILIAGHALSSC